MTNDNPITAAIKYLESNGFTPDEARNLCAAIRSESAETLWKNAPIWIEWCVKTKSDYECIVSLAAQGVIIVELGPNGIDDMSIRLNIKDPR